MEKTIRATPRREVPETQTGKGNPRARLDGMSWLGHLVSFRFGKSGPCQRSLRSQGGSSKEQSPAPGPVLLGHAAVALLVEV